MSRSIKQSCTMFQSQEQIELKHLLTAILTDLTALKTAVDSLETLTDELGTDGDAVFADLTAIRAAFVALTAKMDADFADVTNASVDYAASVNPAALTATAIAAAAATTVGTLSLTE